jgi:Fe-S-cluster containining protein
MSKPRSVRQRLAAIYAKVPPTNCIGKCANACTTFPVPRAEGRLIRRVTGVEIGLRAGNDQPLKTCPLLTADRQCGAYDVRPLICRLWGATDGMICPHGCRPERLMPLAETFALMAEVYLLGGQHHEARRWHDMERLGVHQHTALWNDITQGSYTPAEVEALVAETLRRSH